GDVSISLINANDDADGVLGDVVIQADFAGVGGGLSDGVGAIIDNLGAETPNIIANQVGLAAGSGIGTDAEDLDLSASLLAALTSTGDIHVGDTAGGLTIGAIAGVASGVQIT